jgi:hypothetical protein
MVREAGSFRGWGVLSLVAPLPPCQIEQVCFVAVRGLERLAFAKNSAILFYFRQFQELPKSPAVDYANIRLRSDQEEMDGRQQ